MTLHSWSWAARLLQTPETQWPELWSKCPEESSGRPLHCRRFGKHWSLIQSRFRPTRWWLVIGFCNLQRKGEKFYHRLKSSTLFPLWSAYLTLQTIHSVLFLLLLFFLLYKLIYLRQCWLSLVASRWGCSFCAFKPRKEGGALSHWIPDSRQRQLRRKPAGAKRWQLDHLCWSRNPDQLNYVKNRLELG